MSLIILLKLKGDHPSAATVESQARAELDYLSLHQVVWWARTCKYEASLCAISCSVL
jgi:hypothetical protein